jgi:hypothetical protein
MTAVITGGCQCGAVRYAIAGPLTNPHICHCRMCQKAFGNILAALVSTRKADLTWTRGQPGFFRSSSIVSRGYCRDCGTPLSVADDDSETIAVSIGSLDDPGLALPVRQFGTESMYPAFNTLHLLPGSRTADEVPPERLQRYKSLQHPDHDTENWP